MWWHRAKTADKQYLVPNRLADVLALIQVLALDEHAHRSEAGLDSELQGSPKSGGTWADVAKMHPEFFRVRPESTHGVSLVSRHVLPKDEHGIRRLPSDFVGQLMAAAVDLYDRQVKRSERWIYLVRIWVALLVGLFGLLGAVLRAVFKQDQLGSACFAVVADPLPSRRSDSGPYVPLGGVSRRAMLAAL